MNGQPYSQAYKACTLKNISLIETIKDKAICILQMLVVNKLAMFSLVNVCDLFALSARRLSIFYKLNKFVMISIRLDRINGELVSLTQCFCCVKDRENLLEYLKGLFYIQCLFY